MKKEEECSSSNKIINKASYPKYPTSENKKNSSFAKCGNACLVSSTTKDGDRT